MSDTPTGAYPRQPRKQSAGMAEFRESQRRVFGSTAPPDPPPKRPAMPPQPTNRYARPVPVEHVSGCDSRRLDTTGWTDGRRVTRCLDCEAEATAVAL